MEPDGYVEHISYEYVKTGKYKTVVRECANEVGLVTKFDTEELDFHGVLDKTLTGAPRFGCTVKGVFTLTNPETFEAISFSAHGFGLGDGGNCVSIAETNAVRNVITNGLMINTGHDDDVADANKTDGGKGGHKYLTAEEKEAKATMVKADTKPSVTYVQEPAAIDLYERLLAAVALEETSDKNKASFLKLLVDHYENDGTPKTEDGHLTLTKGIFTKFSTKLDEILG